MYKVLIISKSFRQKEEVIDEKVHSIKYATADEIREVLRDNEFDLIYFEKKLITEDNEERILDDFIKVPKILGKLKLKIQTHNTYINLQILNKLIINNINIVKFNGYLEEMLVASIIKEKIINDTEIDINKIMNKLFSKKEKRMATKILVDVVSRYFFKEKNISRYEFIFNRKILTNKFINIILRNIKLDIKYMEQIKKDKRKDGIMDKIKVIIADDDKGICYLLQKQLEKNKNIEVVGVANTDEQEIEMIETLKPDIVITDLMRNHEYTGLDIIKEYFKKEEKPEFLVVSADKKEDVINNGLEVAGYLKKPFNLTLITDEVIRIKKEIIDFKNKEE